MQNYTAVIVEDEVLPLLSLKEKLKIYHPDIQIIGAYDNCDSALEGIINHKPDIMFLDIQLPEKNSIWLIDMLKTVTSAPLPEIIFTTASNDTEYLLKAVKFSAVDYLLKPIALDELATAIQKVKTKINKSYKNKNTEKTFSFKTLNSILLVKEEDILYCEADGNYCQIFLTHNTKEMVFERLGDVAEKICNETKIIRAGRSHLVNISHIKKVNTKKQLCYFQISPQTNVSLRISESGMEDVLAVFNGAVFE